MNKNTYLITGGIIIIASSIIWRWYSLPSIVRKDFNSSWFESRYYLESNLNWDFDSLYKVTIYKGFFRPIKRIKDQQELGVIKASLVGTTREPDLQVSDSEKIFIYNNRREIIGLGARVQNEWLIRTKDGMFELNDNIINQLN